MFRFEKEMIPVLTNSISTIYKTKYIATEFGTGNGVADVVFTTKLNKEELFLEEYGLISLYVDLFENRRIITSNVLNRKEYNPNKLKRLLNRLESQEYIYRNEGKISRTKKYQAHTTNLISIEAKLHDWKSGIYQALRYKFFSHETYLAFPLKNIQRVDVGLLNQFNVGLIGVDNCKIEFIKKPKLQKPSDKVSFFFLSEMLAQKFKS